MSGLPEPDEDGFNRVATIGHTLVGLSLSGVGNGRTLGGTVWRYAWPGIMVLMAHLVDLVEWAVMLAAPTYFDEHFVTNSPLVTAGIVAGVWLAMYLLRIRRVWPYVVVAVAVFSHLLLDHRAARVFLMDAFDITQGTEAPGLLESILAEAWLYGLLLVSVYLVRATRVRGCPRRGRVAAGVLAGVALIAAVSRITWLWMPAYALAGLHATLLLRSNLTSKYLWSLLPLIPLAGLLVVELWASHLFHQALTLQLQKDYAGAAAKYKQALDVPTRSKQVYNYVRCSQCLQQLGDLSGAEANLRYAARVCEQPYWAEFALANLYSSPQTRGTDFYRPEYALGRYRELLEGPYPARLKWYARRELKRNSDLR